VRKQADVLKHVARAPAQADRVPLAGVALLHQDRALLGNEEAVNQLQQRGLACPAAADQRQRFAAANGHVEAGEHPAWTVGVGHASEFHNRAVRGGFQHATRLQKSSLE
jgi:hypothetical protein